MRRLRNPAGQTTAHLTTRDTAARRGHVTQSRKLHYLEHAKPLRTNQNANAIRFGTLYNFRFDADQPPQAANATVGFFKTGSPMMVAIQAPAGGDANADTNCQLPPLRQRQQQRRQLLLPRRHTATPRPTPTPRSIRHRDLAQLLRLVRSRRR